MQRKTWTSHPVYQTLVSTCSSSDAQLKQSNLAVTLSYYLFSCFFNLTLLDFTFSVILPPINCLYTVYLTFLKSTFVQIGFQWDPSSAEGSEDGIWRITCFLCWCPDWRLCLQKHRCTGALRSASWTLSASVVDSYMLSYVLTVYLKQIINWIKLMYYTYICY